MSSAAPKPLKNDLSLRRLGRSCGEVCLILKALSHPLRLMILRHLMGGDKTVSEVVHLWGGSQSQVSQFLLRMRAEGLVHCRREGRFQYYSVADKRLYNLMKTLQSEYCS